MIDLRELLFMKTKSAPSARSAFDFIVGLNFYELLVIVVMVAVMIVVVVVMVVIVPVAITVPAAAFHVPPPMRVCPAVFPRVM